MLDCSARNEVVCDEKSDMRNSTETCGSSIAFPYFISFYVLCSFLVSLLILCLIYAEINEIPNLDH